MRFEYLEIRPAIEIRNIVHHWAETKSYDNEAEFEVDLAGAKTCDDVGFSFKAFWTLYGRYDDPTPDGKSQFLAMAIGDFPSKDDAHKIMNAILAPMAAARDALDAGSRFMATEGDLLGRIDSASKMLDDFINQCSNMERI